MFVETRVERPVVSMRLLRSQHRAAVLLAGFFLSIGNQAFVSKTMTVDVLVDADTLQSYQMWVFFFQNYS